MGVRPSEKGVTLIFLDKDGKPSSQPVSGAFAFLFSSPRDEAPGDPDPVHGSQDWLSDAIVVDNPAKLKSMKICKTSIATTSKSSKKVCVQWDTAGFMGSMEGCFTIADGRMEGSNVFADTLTVLPPETDMRPGHLLWYKWKDGVISFQVLAGSTREQIK
jgi:hypothetical protein